MQMSNSEIQGQRNKPCISKFGFFQAFRSVLGLHAPPQIQDIYK